MTSRPIDAELVFGRELYQRVVLDKLAHARESVLIATANVKAMLVEVGAGRDAFQPVVALFSQLAARGVAVRLLHAELPSRPFRAAFDRDRRLTSGGLHLKICPRVHLKAVIVDGAWLYIGSANLTGAGLGAKHEHARNFELGLLTEDFDTIDRVTAALEAVWNGAECRHCRLYDVCPDPIGPRPKPARRRPGSKKGGVVLGRAKRFGR